MRVCVRVCVHTNDGRSSPTCFSRKAFSMGLLLLTLSVLIPCSNPAKPSRTGIPQTPTKPTIPSAKSSFAPPPTPTIPGTARTSEKAEVGADNVEADLHYPTGTPNVGMSNLQDSGTSLLPAFLVLRAAHHLGPTMASAQSISVDPHAATHTRRRFRFWHYLPV